MIKVLLSDKFSPEIFELSKVGNFEIVEKVGMSKEELMSVIGDFDCILIRSATKLTADVIEKGVNLKLIGRGGIGVDNVDIPFATSKNIKVMNTPNSNAESTAEHAIALMFAAAREVPYATSSMKQGIWDKKTLEGRQLGGSILGLVGIGNIGKIVASKAHGLGTEVVVYDPYVIPDASGCIEIPSKRYNSSFKVKVVTFDELLKQSDFISIHTPLTNSTKNLFSKEQFNKMKPNAYLINNSRGGIVNEADLYEALKGKTIAGAAFDVFTEEPFKASPLLELRNFICSPHISASTIEAQLQVAIDLVNQVKAFFVDNKHQCILN